MRQLNIQEVLSVTGATCKPVSCAPAPAPTKSPLQCLTDFFYFVCKPKISCAPKPTCAPKPSCGTPTPPPPAPTPAPDL
jgi:hypothetical protein